MKRSSKGQKIYVESMEKSAQDKMRLFPFIRGGTIVDMGAGAGAVTKLLSDKFPNSKILSVDNSLSPF